MEIPSYRDKFLKNFEEQKSDEKIFHSFIDSINNAIGNKAQYDFDNDEDFNKFIEDYLEEFVFCMYNDSQFKIELLEIPNEFLIKKDNGEYVYFVKNSSHGCPIKSPSNIITARSIFKNPQNGCACIYKYEIDGYEPLFIVNFVYSKTKEDKEIELYKKIIPDYISLKEIKSLFDFRKIIIQNFKNYKNNNGKS